MDIIRGGNALKRISKTITFTGAAGAGAVGSVTAFTTTGELLVVVLVPFCTVNLTDSGGAATLILGTTGATSLFIASTTAVNIDANEFWVDNAPDANGIAVPAALKDIAITDNIIMTVGTEDITGGAIRFDAYYMPLSSGATLA